MSKLTGKDSENHCPDYCNSRVHFNKVYIKIAPACTPYTSQSSGLKKTLYSQMQLVNGRSSDLFHPINSNDDDHDENDNDHCASLGIEEVHVCFTGLPLRPQHSCG